MTAVLATRPIRTLPDDDETVAPLRTLLARGWTHSSIRAQVMAQRWQRFGYAVVLHNASLRDLEKARVAQFNCGPRAALTAFTGAHVRGLRGWERQTAHVVVPAGARVRLIDHVPTRVHWTSDWGAATENARNGVVTLERAVVAAATVLPSTRSACGIVAASVQQRLTTADRLVACVDAQPRLTHRGALVAALADIGQGSQALSEIDFVRLCRTYGLPEPDRQAVRIEPSGRRRYLDAEWRRRDGRRVVAEVDGALHLIATTWWDDQLRQNEVVISDRSVLRFPSVIVRHEDALVADQLGRMLAC